MRARDTECIRVRTVSVFISSMMASVFADARTTDVRAACVGRATDFYDDEYATRGQSRGMGQIAIASSSLERAARARAPPASRIARAHGCLKISPTRILARVTRRARRPTRAHRAETLARARGRRPSRRHSRQGIGAPSIVRAFVPVANDARTLETLVANAGEATTRAAVAEIVKDIV